ncbi:MAG: FHA domain-containing protein [Planctomycetota bacterium]
MKIGDFVDHYGTMGFNAFLARFDCPFLVTSLPLTGTSARDISALDRWPLSGLDSTIQHVRKETGKLFTLVSPLSKSDRNPYHPMISAGRGSANDVVLPSRSVSRKHADFSVDMVNHTVTVEDLGSSYGTEINGLPIGRSGPIPVTNGAKLVFAKTLHGTLFFPKEFHKYIQTLSQVRGN